MTNRISNTGLHRFLGFVRPQEYQRLIVVANRLPVTVQLTADGDMAVKPSKGGLASGLGDWCRSQKGLDLVWVGWPGDFYHPETEALVARAINREFPARPIFCPEPLWREHYLGFSNRVLWPLFHILPQYVHMDEGAFEAYSEVNRQFAEAVAEILRPGDFVWIHDYQLMLVPQMLRSLAPDALIGYFHHIPFPVWDVMRLLPQPWSHALIEGLLGADLVGFHTQDYTRHFLHAVNRVAQLDHDMGTVWTGGRRVTVGTYPMGIDFQGWEQAVAAPAARERTTQILNDLPGQEVILSVDRLDYTKGVHRRLEAFDLFLSENPKWHGRATMLLIVVPSREDIGDYEELKREIDRLVGDINGRYGLTQWTPVIYQYRSLGREELAGTYAACRAAMVTPLRDGMNLVAKEYLACRPDGALIVSEMAGAAGELAESWRVNPYDVRQQANALLDVLEADPSLILLKNVPMRQRLQRYNLMRWADDFLRYLFRTQAIEPEPSTRRLDPPALVNGWKKASHRLLLSDYDGTLVGFQPRPELAAPDEALLRILKGLCSHDSLTPVVVSGRPRETLEAWLGHLPLGLAAEHGAYVRPAGGEWLRLGPADSNWKEILRPIFQQSVDRVVGSLLEEKEFSLAYHWRAADNDQGVWQAAELEETLRAFTGNDLSILRGNKVLEVRPASVNKGVAALWFITLANPDLILAAGDDWTDEDMFKALPVDAWTIKIGWGQTNARHRVGGPAEYRLLLDSLGSATPTPAVLP